MRAATIVSTIAAAALLVPLFTPARGQSDGADSLKLTITGFVAFQAGLLAQDDREGEPTDRDYDFGSGARLQFDLTAKTDGGLSYGGRVRMNNVDPRDGVTVDRAYVWVEGSFGRATFGDQYPVGDDVRHAFVYDDGVICPWGNYGCNIDGRWNDLAGNTAFYSIGLYRSPSGLSTDTRIRYDTPDIAGSGVTFSTAFTPVVGGNAFKGPGQRNDLFDDGAFYQNVIEGGLTYKGTVRGIKLQASAAAAYGDGVDGNDDLEGYAIGVMGGADGLTVSLDYTILPSAGATINGQQDLQTIALAAIYAFTDDLLFGLGYSFTTGQSLPFADGDAAARADLDADHIASGTLLYRLAPGLTLFGEVTYESQQFGGFEGDADAFPGDVETTVVMSGTHLRF